MTQSNTIIHTFKLENNILQDLGKNKYGKQNIAWQLDINMRDLRQFYIDVSFVEARKNTILLALSDYNLVIRQNSVHIVVLPNTENLICNFINFYNKADHFNKQCFELKCVEAVLMQITKDFQSVYKQCKKERKTFTVFQNIKQVAQSKQKLTRLQNDISRVLDAIYLLQDSQIDVLSLYFKNQLQLYQYNQDQIPQFIYKQQNINKRVLESIFQQQSENHLHNINKDKFELTDKDINELLDTYVYQLQFINTKSQSLLDKMQSSLQIQQIKMNALRNKIMMFQVFADILCASLAIGNMFTVVMGSNCLGFWNPYPFPGPLSKDSENHEDFDGLSISFASISIIYILIFWFIFIFKLNQMNS